MVDLHSHILPGLDDGASTLEDTLAMLRLAAASGTTAIVATPHCNAQYPFQPAVVAQLISELATRTNGIPAIHAGCDLHLSYDNLRDALDYPTKYTVNHGPYLLVELPDLVSFAPIRQMLRELLNTRLIPVITHPERNASLQRHPRELKAWVADGCLIQITAQSLLGTFGATAQRAAHNLIESKLVHFIASDAHNITDRSPDLSVAFQYVSARYSPAHAHRLFIANPSAALHGHLLPRPASKLAFLSHFFTRVKNI